MLGRVVLCVRVCVSRLRASRAHTRTNAKLSPSTAIVTIATPQVEALFLTLLNASHSDEEDPSRFLAKYLQADSAKPPDEAEKLKLSQETLPLATFALFLREVQGEELSAEVCVCVCVGMHFGCRRAGVVLGFVVGCASQGVVSRWTFES